SRYPSPAAALPRPLQGGAPARLSRAETKVRTRQPLAEAVAHLPGHAPAIDELLPIIADELNVKEGHIATADDALRTWQSKPDFRVLGPRLGQRVQAVAGRLAADDGTIADRL